MQHLQKTKKSDILLLQMSLLNMRDDTSGFICNLMQ